MSPSREGFHQQRETLARCFRTQGAEGLDSAPHYQPPSRLTDKQQTRLIRTLLRGAQASGYASLESDPAVRRELSRGLCGHALAQVRLERAEAPAACPRAGRRCDSALAAAGVVADKKGEPSKKLTLCFSTKLGACCNRCAVAPGLRVPNACAIRLGPVRPLQRAGRTEP